MSQNQENEIENNRTEDSRSFLKKDAEEVGKSLIERIRTAITKPITMTIAAAVFVLTLGVEYGFSRIMDALWEVEPPEEIVRLNSELQSSTGQLRETSEDLQGLVSRIDTAAIEDPRLREQLEQLNQRLLGFSELVDSTSANSSRVATLSQTLQDDYVRLKERSDGNIDSVPDLMLSGGEAVMLCNGLTAFGVRQLQQGRVWYNVSDRRDDVVSGSRIQIGEQAYLDFMGVRDGQAMFKVNCDGMG